MHTRRLAAAAASGILALSLAACGDSEGGDGEGGGSSTSSAPAAEGTTSPTSTAEGTTSPATDGATTSTTEAATASPSGSAAGQATTLTVATAQQIVRTILDPQTSAAEAQTLVDSTDAQVGTKIVAFAKAADQGGYTPSAFTAKTVTGTGDQQARANFEVKSPHAPAAVPMPFTFVDKGGWKLSQQSVTQLLAMGRGGGGAR